MNKRRDLSVEEKLDVLKKYDELPQMSQRQAACKLNVSQSLLGRMLKSRQKIENASLANVNSNRKRKRVGKEEEVEDALKQWFTKVREKDARVTGPLLLQKAEELAKKMDKNNFVATEGWFHRWKNRENISFVKPHGEQGEADHAAARSWIHSEWPSLIAKYPPSSVLNADETGLYFRALPEHTYAFKNEKN
ncbi:tigger transposable element-derived protein 6-like [Daktulosphaira vitifoliae]|uniref:tigger transposable element-derived protein 6-like n=1 Tax=Daktulosphaira vitifoliae TaxID=58002 RepID=UPI0021AA84C4|nr:tigger transposable element-derived protein 6-like [Daktulosphaira vitifoliae]